MRSHRVRVILCVVAAVSTALLAACGDDDAPETASTDDPTTTSVPEPDDTDDTDGDDRDGDGDRDDGSAAPGDPEFCAELERVEERFASIDDDLDVMNDPGGAATVFDQAGDLFDGIDPPAELREDWETAIEGLRAFAELYRGLDPDDPASLEDFEERATTMGDEAERYDEAFGNITDYSVDRCGIDLEG
jgi:hypothetical protein